MANVHFVFYERNRGTVGRRPAVFSVVLDEAVSPTYSTYGLNTTDHSHVRLSTFDANSLSTGKSVTVNSLATLPSTAADYEVGRQVILTLEEEQAQQQVVLDTLIANTDWTQSLDSKLTLASRNAFKAWRDEVAGISDPTSAYYQATWASAPANIVIPEEPTPAFTTTDQGERIGEWAGDNALSTRHVFMPDKLTMVPDFSFADNDTSLFVTSGCTISMLAGSNLSGGYALLITKTSAAGTNASVRSHPDRYFSVSGNGNYIADFNHRAHGASDIAGAVAMQIETFGNDKVTSTGTSSRAFQNTSGSAWTADRYQYEAAGTARWGGVGIFLAASLPAGTQVRVDNASVRKALLHTDLDSSLGSYGQVLIKASDGSYRARNVVYQTFQFDLGNIGAGVAMAMDRIFSNSSTGGGTAVQIGTRDVLMDRPGRAVAITLEARAPVDSGNITARVSVNGSAFVFDGNSVQIGPAATRDSRTLNFHDAGTVAYQAGDGVGLNLITTAGYLPITNDFKATLTTQSDPF